MDTQPTPQKRHQVFVSSTYLDLKDERQAVTAALLESDAFPAGMELFPATDDDAWTLIRRVIDESDYYLLVVGGKYGSIDPADDISYTEKEFDYAVQAGKPVMAFLHGDPKSLTVEKSETKPKLQRRLADFRKKVETSKHVKYWTTAEGLAGQVALSYNKMLRYYPTVGWVRADRAASAETLTKLAEARARVAELEADLVLQREEHSPEETASLAQGADVVTFPVYAHAWFTRKGRPRIAAGAYIRVKNTWDELLSVIAPSLLVEAEEHRLREQLDDWLRRENAETAIRATIKRVRARDEALKSVRGLRPEELKVTITDEDFGTIMLQFKALGLIQESSRRRSVADKGAYWSLTPRGEAIAVKARAIKRTGDPLTELPDADTEPEEEEE